MYIQSVNVLGVAYDIFYATKEEFRALETVDGYTDTSTRQIIIDDMSSVEGEPDAKGDLDEYRKNVVRHEIIHAFLHESGLAANSNSVESWATNEEMVDWFAIQWRKIQRAFEQVNCI